MKVTGYKLREALRRWQLRRDTAAAQFDKSLSKFEDEDKPAPQAIVAKVLEAESAIARLQAAQARYNLAVTVKLWQNPKAAETLGPETLLACVKRVGGLARVEKMWRKAAGTEKEPRTLLFGNRLSRDKDHEQAKPTISPDEASKQAEVYGALLAVYREAIATGNATELAIEDLDAALLE